MELKKKNECNLSPPTIELLKEFKLTPFQARVTCSLINKGSEFVKIPSQELSSAYGGRSGYADEIKYLPYVEQTSYQVGKKIKGYRINFGLHKKLSDSEMRNITTETKAEYINLISGKQAYPSKVIYKSLLKSSLQKQVAKKYEPIAIQNFTKSMDKFLVGKELKQQLNAYCAALAFLKTGVYNKDTDTVASQPVYCERSSGRIFSGFQVSSRELQYLWYKDYLNYDIEASQLNILIQEKQKLKQPINELNRFLHEKNRIIEELNIEKSLFKTILYCLVFGGSLPTIKYNKTRSLNEELLDYCTENNLDYATLAKSVIDCFSPLKAEIKTYHDSLDNPINCLGLKCQSTDRKRLAAHHIQGMEAKWITLVVSQSDGVHLNYHDGLITSSEVRDSAIRFANRAMDLDLKFIQKPII